MLGRSILMSLLVISVSAQDPLSFLKDRHQTSRSSLPNYFDNRPHNERTIGSGSLLRDQGSLLQTSGLADLGLQRGPSSLTSSVSDGSRFMDTLRRGQGMFNGNSRMNQNDNLLPRGLNLPNLQSSLSPMNQRLSGFQSSALSSVLDGRSFGDELSGFSRSTPWDRSRGARALTSFQSPGRPLRLLNNQSPQSGMSHIDLNGAFTRRIGNGLELNRWNMQRDMSAGQINLLRDLDVNRPLNGMLTPNRISLDTNPRRMDDIWISRNGGVNPLRPLSQNRMLPLRRFGPITSLPSTSQVSFLRTGLGPTSALGRSQLSSNLDRTPLTSNRLTQPSLTSTFGRTSQRIMSSLSRDLASGPRTSRTTVYQPISGLQRFGQHRGAGRITSI